jgi:uncharacterized protein YjeT (DUF2065 family)
MQRSRETAWDDAGTAVQEVVVQKIVLWVLAIVFVLVGLGFLLAPETFTEMATETSPDGGAPLTEIRAVSGGVALGLGVFWALCAQRAAWTAAGLTLGALVGAGLALGRVVGFAADGGVTGMQVAFAVAEVLTVLVCVLVLRTDRSVQR